MDTVHETGTRQVTLSMRIDVFAAWDKLTPQEREQVYFTAREQNPLTYSADVIFHVHKAVFSDTSGALRCTVQKLRAFLAEWFPNDSMVEMTPFGKEVRKISLDPVYSLQRARKEYLDGLHTGKVLPAERATLALMAYLNDLLVHAVRRGWRPPKPTDCGHLASTSLLQ